MQILFTEEGHMSNKGRNLEGGYGPSKSSCWVLIYFHALPLTYCLPLCLALRSKPASRSSACSVSPSPLSQTPTLNRFFSDLPLVVLPKEKKHECTDVKSPSKNTVKDWFLRPTLHRWELNGKPCKPGDGIKMSSLLEKGGKTAHLSSVHQPWKREGRKTWSYSKKSPYSPLTIPKDVKLISMNIKSLWPEKERNKRLDPSGFTYYWA